MTYQQQYTSFLSTLHQDTRPWITDGQPEETAKEAFSRYLETLEE